MASREFIQAVDKLARPLDANGNNPFVSGPDTKIGNPNAPYSGGSRGGTIQGDYYTQIQALSGQKIAATPATQQNMFQAQLVAYQQEVRRRGETAANGAQEATIRYWIETKNAGSSREPAFNFSVAFLNEPHMTHGFAVAVNHTFGNLFMDPIGNATILQWVRNDRGHYIGVRMSYWADCPQRNPYVKVNQTFDGKDKPSFLGIHHVSFTGTAYKAFSAADRTRIATVQPNPVSYATDAPGQPNTSPGRPTGSAPAGGTDDEYLDQFVDSSGLRLLVNRIVNPNAPKPDLKRVLAQLDAAQKAIAFYYPGYPGAAMNQVYINAAEEHFQDEAQAKEALRLYHPKEYNNRFGYGLRNNRTGGGL